ncbi:MAG: translation elongation factor Ts [Candidatus Levybacteria bacterium]|nr:translation elongation factor Ts [Candidatus Levybacteria bacterium]
MVIDVKLIKQLRGETAASIADCRKALEETSGDLKKALEWLKKHGIEKAEKKADRKTSQGLIEAYIHQNGKVGALVEILCETDFVARTDDFKKLAHEIAMQVAALDPKDVDTLLKQEYIRDGSMTIEQLLKQTIGTLGENIVIKKITRFEI